MVAWKTIQSLAIFFGPLLLPKAIGYYRAIRSRPASQIKPLPTTTSYALGVLFLSGVLAFLSTLPVFHPQNIFRLTSSRLQTSAGVLLSRLSAHHPPTAQDEKLRQVFDAGGLDARLLYARFGPNTLTTCPFATPNDRDAGQMYLLYAAPSLLAPHLLHLIALGIATSRSLSGMEGSKWCTVATITGLLLGAAELYYVANYDSTANARSTRLGEVDFAYWKMHVYRGLAIATLDAVLGWVIWLQATGRAFLTPPAPAERIGNSARVFEGVVGKARGLGIIRNGVVRNADMRRKVDGYWVKEGEVMKDVFEEPEVLEAQRSALRRLDLVRVGREAEGFLNGLFGTVEAVQPEAQVSGMEGAIAS
ncbi:uncharacterized protein LTR77_004493 [Saxophila tyrrhenica]|uniref:Uncharacterized protein n=1 Tax=Saxophila tyrrhenica TaxID=1690608 RepID=A0AAV9PCV6_9PEZI|nr:hypothetical protein LTR77_004493 [Saxophila tyrrhenica]